MQEKLFKHFGKCLNEEDKSFPAQRNDVRVLRRNVTQKDLLRLCIPIPTDHDVLKKYKFILKNSTPLIRSRTRKEVKFTRLLILNSF